MTLLLDSHTFLWFCQDDPMLSPAARALIENHQNRKIVSVASFWEIAIKAGLKKLNLGEPAGSYFTNALARTGFEVLAISVEHAAAVEALPVHHKDPFDRMLASQALSDRFAIVSADAVFDQYGVTRVW